MKVKVIHNFYDTQADMMLRKIGEEIEVTEARAFVLESKKLVECVKADKVPLTKDAKQNK